MKLYKIEAGNSIFSITAKSFQEALEKINLEFDLNLTENNTQIISAIAINSWTFANMEKVFLASVFGDDSKMLGEIEACLDLYKNSPSEDPEAINRIWVLEALKAKYELL